MGDIISALGELAEPPAIDDWLVLTDKSDTSQGTGGTTKKNKPQYGLGSQVNAQTGTTYTYLTTDFRKLVTHTNAGAIAGTLPQAGASFPAGWFMLVQNRGAGAVTITPTTSTIDGAATLVLNQNEGAIVVSDGTNYFTLRGKATGAAGVGDFVGPSSSVDSEIVLFDGTTGKLGKRATGSGLVKATSGVYSTVTAPSGAVVGDTDTQTLTNKILILTAAHGSDDTWTGTGISGLNAGATIAQWEAVYLDGSSTWQLADANGTDTYPARGLATAAYSSTDPAVILVHGTIRNDAWNWTPGGAIYLSATAGGLTQTAPSTSGDKVQQVGFALTADIAFFDFNSTYLTVT